MTNWLQLLDDSDPASLKAKVRLAAVVQHHGVALRPEGDRLVGNCPFHNDQGPSFAVWRNPDDEGELCGCWSCDFGVGDVFDFLQRLLNLSFTKAFNLVSEYVRDNVLASAPAIPERDPNAPRPDFDALVRDARLQPLTALHGFLDGRGLQVPAEWIAAEFKVGVSEATGELVIPHYGSDGVIHGVKHRDPVGKPIAYDGSRLDNLYGVWRMHGHKQVVIVEGETDTWAAAYLLQNYQVDVVGLPRGVSSRVLDAWLDVMRGKVVVLMLDADDAGRRGSAKWLGALTGVAERLLVAALPDGEDVCSAGFEEVLHAFHRAWPFVDPASLAITKSTAGYYVKINPQTGAVNVLSDFTFELQRLIHGADTVLFEVTGPMSDEEYRLTARELANPNRLREWSHSRLLSWKGGSREGSELLELLKAEAILAPRARATDVTGLQGTTFVLPESTIGGRGWAFVPGAADVRPHDLIGIQPGEWDPRLPAFLSALHRSDIITPVLGWMGAAPLRSLCPQFPILGLTGGAGWGKTALTKTVLNTFGYWKGDPMTLSSTTAHGVFSFVSSTNAFPVWFDEYRTGANAPAKTALDQAIRDAWDGSASVKGGYGEDKVAITKLYARAPIVVTGEDAFSETSHAERMVLIPMPMDGRNPQALQAVHTAVRTGFGHSYLSWLVALMRRGELPAPPVRQTRMELSLAIAEWGYGLLRQFTREVCNYDLQEFDNRRVVWTQQDMAATSPMKELIKEGLGRTDPGGIQYVWIDGNDLCLRHNDLVAWAQRQGTIVLPGNAKAVLSWLREQYIVLEDRAGGVRSYRCVGAAPDYL